MLPREGTFALIVFGHDRTCAALLNGITCEKGIASKLPK